MSDKTNDFGLTRRKMLFGLGTVGLAAGGMGAGTWAGYVDTETKRVTTHAGSLDLKISEDGQGGWRDGPIPVQLPQMYPGSEVEDCEYLTNFGQTDGLCLSFAIPGDSVVSDEGESVYPGQPEVYNPESETNTELGDGGELDDQLLMKGHLEDIDGNVLTGFDYVAFNRVVGHGITLPCLLRKDHGNMLKMCFSLKFPHREDNNDAMKDALAFDIDVTLHQTCEEAPETSVGDDWGKFQFEGGDDVWFARGRYGNNLSEAGNFELALGESPSNSTKGGRTWTSGQSEPFELSYDGSGSATFTVGGTTISNGSVPAPAGDAIAITVIGEEHQTTMVENVKLDGKDLADDVVSASAGKRHLLIDNADTQDGFALTGDMTFTWSANTANERPSFHIHVE